MRHCIQFRCNRSVYFTKNKCVNVYGVILNVASVHDC